MTPTREQLIEEIAGKLWRDLCEGEGQHSEALDKSLIRKHMDRLAACLAVPLPGACLCCRDGCQDGQVDTPALAYSQVGDVIEFAHGDDPPMFQRLTHPAAVEDWNGKLRNRVRGIYRRIYPLPAAPPDGETR